MSQDANIDPATTRVLAGIENEELAVRYPNRAHFISADNPHQGEMATRALFEGDPVVIVYPDGHELLVQPEQAQDGSTASRSLDEGENLVPKLVPGSTEHAGIAFGTMSGREELNEQAMTAFAERAGDGLPVVMLNLLAFAPEGGQERYGEYGEAVAPLLEKVGARIVFAGAPASPLIGGEEWDLVALVEYPDRQAFLDMVGSAEYQAIEHLRTEALARSVLQPIDTAG
ncbi:MAG: DUF1330 domain-containing protein [Chloroflexota bacterium]